VHLEEFPRVLDDNELTDHNDHPHTHEHGIGEQSNADVNLVVDLSSSDHIKDLHEHKDVEDNGQVPGWCNILEVTILYSATEVLSLTIQQEFKVVVFDIVFIWMA